MIFEFEPWKLDVDVEATRLLYEQNHYEKNIQYNELFVRTLSNEQLRFFDSLGVNLMRVDVDYKRYDIKEEDGVEAFQGYRMRVNFLMRGSLLMVPEYQRDIYAEEELFGSSCLKTLELYSTKQEDYFKVYDNGIGFGIVFKHPCLQFDDPMYQSWNCGYILGSILVVKEQGGKDESYFSNESK